MDLNTDVIAGVEADLKVILGTSVRIRDARSISGGSINDAWALETSGERYFLKTNPADRHPSRFVPEAADLALLASTNELRTPKVIATGEAAGTAWLLLEFHHAKAWTSDADAELGRGLAKQHRHSQPHFGLDRDNWIGLLPQDNTPASDWATFLVQHRLAPLVRMARDHQRIGDGDVLRFERLYAVIPDLIPQEKPALLHGDLWHGNALYTADGVVVVDPAAYYGHREMDVAMAGLFGGIGPGLLDAYNNEWPMEPGWEGRIDLCRLYPLLVHLNLFGGGYAAQVSAALRKYV